MVIQKEKLLYSINDAAYALSLSRPTIYAEINSGRLPFIQYKSRKYITRKALEIWIRDREIEFEGVRKSPNYSPKTHAMIERVREKSLIQKRKGDHRECA